MHFGRFSRTESSNCSREANGSRYRESESTSPRGERSRDRAAGWIEAIRGGGQSPGSFLNAGSITDTVNLGTVALRAGKKVLFDSAKMEITNVPQANRYLRREYRPGWEL